MELNSEVQDNAIKPILLTYGGAKKFVAEMNEEELQAARESILRRAKEKAFSKGLPLYYTLDTKLVAECADGRIVRVVR